MKNSIKVLEDSFHLSHTHLYDLIYEVQFSRFRYLILKDSEAIGLGDYFIGKENNIEDTREKVIKIISEHEFLNSPNWRSVTVISEFEIQTVLPIEAYLEGHELSYLRINYPSAHLEKFDLGTMEFKNEVLVSGTLKEINDIFRLVYPERKVRFMGKTGVVLTYFKDNIRENHLGLVSDTFFDFYYQVPKSNISNILRIPLSKMGTIGINGKTTMVFGEITPYAPLFKELEVELKHLKIGELQPEIQLSESFADISLQRYFTLLIAYQDKLAVNNEIMISSD